ncbi:uncharacterized protein LOC123552425 isoform X2 [Mercenaria mercenaria]|uniref:uncharacterized protein LOC123552425 isoform X2 n=1 Tax=Mercenaria mercenaria TaxID=6596 RepID=UPI00234F444F|nr:uncharacterized protein LOC123552425 isoform X2 [Mercenaria mercenaria]
MDQCELRNPPESYAFNNLIQDFCEAMDENDVRKVKRRFQDILPERIQNGQELVDALIENAYISDRNIVYLQQIVRILKKEDLLTKTIQYANKQREKVLHFHVSSTKLRPGYTLIKIHVEGHTYNTEGDLQRLRQTISDIVLVPLEDISVISMETTKSLLITFMLPELYVKVLHAFLDTEKFHLFQPLIRLGVDEIIVSGESYNIKLGLTPPLITTISDSSGGAFSGLPTIDTWYRKIKTIFSYPFNMPARNREIGNQDNGLRK